MRQTTPASVPLSNGSTAALTAVQATAIENAYEKGEGNPEVIAMYLGLDRYLVERYVADYARRKAELLQALVSADVKAKHARITDRRVEAQNNPFMRGVAKSNRGRLR
jgi:hypothetical protein